MSMVAPRIALRYLFSRKSHHAVNIISWISMAGVAVATMAIICVLSVFNGFTDLSYSRLSAVDPAIKIIPAKGKTIQQADSLCEVLTESGLMEICMPVVEEQALAIYAQQQIPVRIKGIPDGYERVTRMDSIIIDGEYLLHDTDYDCGVLSVGAAINLGARPGYNGLLQLYVPRRTGRLNPANPMAAFRGDSLVVSGVFQLEQNEYDADMIYVPLDVARGLLEYGTESSALEGTPAPGVTPQILSDRLGHGFTVLDRLQQEESSYRMIRIEKWITFLMLAFILAIASFNIISTLSMLIIEKEENIATLRAMGAPERMISAIFLWEGWLVSIVGGIAGTVIGVAACLAQEWGGFIRLSGDPSQLSVTAYPVRLALPDILAVLALVAVIGLLTGLIANRFIPRARV